MAVLGTFVRFLLKFDAGSGSLGPSEEAQFPEVRSLAAASPLGYYSQHIFEMKNYSGTFLSRERGMYGIHWVNLTAGEVDRTWTAADFAAVEGAIQAFWTGNPNAISTECRLVEHRWYPFGVSVLPPNPPTRVTTLGAPIVGSGTSGWIRQVAGTITLRTGLRRHWGRIYFPFANGTWDQNGQMGPSNNAAYGAAARQMLMVAPAAQGVIPVVWDRNRKLAFGVTAVEVDSVPDIQRRRRPRDTGARAILTS